MTVTVRTLVAAACGSACAAGHYEAADDTLRERLLPRDDECIQDLNDCGFSLFQSRASRGAKLLKALPVLPKCGDLKDPENEECKTNVNWLMHVGKHHHNTSKWLSRMEEVT